MAKEQTESKLKLIHLVYGLLAAAVLIGIAIGAMNNQQKVNTDSIKVKVEKEVFQQHQEQQQRTFEKIDKGIDKMDEKLDKIIEKM